MPLSRLILSGLSLAFLFLALPVTYGESPTPRLESLHVAMQKEVEANHTAGAVTLVLRDGKLIHQAAVGMADRERKIPMQVDSIFWIASMTKSISATTIMTLVDEGKLDLDAPAAKWLPELAKAKLKNGEPLGRPVTLRDLMSHTSGLAFPPRKPTDGAHSLKTYTAELIKAPFSFEPGSQYEYGFGLTVAGHIAEIASGTPFEELVQARILNPLSMNDTMFHPDGPARDRLARSYKTSDDGKGLQRAYNSFVTAEAEEQRMVEPSGGLFSTAKDMGTFYQMILDGGVHQGKRIISEESIRAMTRPHQAGGQPIAYGLGWQCRPANNRQADPFSERSFGHGGAFATHGWIDPEQRLVAVLMVQNVLLDGSNQVRTTFHKHLAP